MNVVSGLLISGVSPVVVGGTGSSLKFFPPVAGTTSSKRGYVYCPGNNRANGQHVYVRAAGNLKSASPVSIGLYAVVESGLPLLLGREVISDGRGPSTSPWMLKAELVGDSASGIVQGFHNGARITNITGVNFASDEPYALAVGVIFSASNEKNSASMFQFDIFQ